MPRIIKNCEFSRIVNQLIKVQSLNFRGHITVRKYILLQIFDEICRKITNLRRPGIARYICKEKQHFLSPWNTFHYIVVYYFESILFVFSKFQIPIYVSIVIDMKTFARVQSCWTTKQKVGNKVTFQFCKVECRSFYGHVAFYILLVEQNFCILHL